MTYVYSVAELAPAIVQDGATFGRYHLDKTAAGWLATIMAAEPPWPTALVTCNLNPQLRQAIQAQALHARGHEIVWWLENGTVVGFTPQEVADGLASNHRENTALILITNVKDSQSKE